MTKHAFRSTHAWGLCCLLLLSGCTTSKYENKIASSHADVSKRNEQANALLRNYPGPTPSVVSSQTPRFTSHSIPFDRSEMLPNHIATVTLRVPGKHSIKTIAELIEQATGIPVNVANDATLPSNMFLPIGMAQQTPTAATPEPAAVAIPAANATPGANATPTTALEPTDKSILDKVQRSGGNRLSANNDPATQNNIELNYSGSLAGLLNQVALRSDLRWSYESGRIRFFRVVSRTMAVKTLPGGLKLSSSLSLTSTGGGSSSSAISSDVNIWTGIEKNLANMVSVSGKLVIDPNTGTVTVRDAFRNVEAIEQYVQNLNQNLMRQVSMTVEVLQITLSNEFQSGIDWSYVSETMRIGQLQLKGPTPVTSAASAGSVGLVLQKSANVTNQLLFQALEKFGRVSSAYSTVVTTVNRQAVPVGSQTTQSYLKSVAPTVISSASGTTYGPSTLTPGEITTGFTLTLLPILLDSNHVLVECGLSLSALKSLTSFNSGTGANLQTIQQPSIANFGVMQRLVAKSSETIVLSGYDQEVSNSEGVDPLIQKVPGSSKGSKERTTTVVLITPRLQDQ